MFKYILFIYLNLRVCIIGDSNSTPHQICDEKLWHLQEMYWYELTKLNFEVIPISFVNNSIKRIFQMSNFFFKHTKCDIFIIQIGVNDITELVIKKKNKWIDILYKIIIKLKLRYIIRKIFYKIKSSSIKKNNHFEKILMI